MHTPGFARLPLLAAALAAPLHADVRLPAFFGDHMVLQRGIQVPIWGQADPGEEVTVAIAGQRKSARAGDGGRFRVDLEPLAAGGPFELVVTGKNRIALVDVLVGEVWICSGQSNMEWSVRESGNPDAEIAAADHPRLRLFKVDTQAHDTPQLDCKGTWQVCSPQSIVHFSAVGYYFGRSLQREIDAPIGLVQSAWGGTPAEAWTPRQVLEADPALTPILERWAGWFRDYPEAKKRHDEAIAAWQQAQAAAKAAGKSSPRRPAEPPGPRHKNRPAGLWNGMIAPLVPFAIRGVIWYQGESNATRAHQYRTLFPSLIDGWRRAWDQGDFPFLFVQLANFAVERGQEPLAWAELREAQAMTLGLPNTGMAVAIDIGDSENIHPKNKQEVGRRLALVARAQVYGEDVVYSGPTYRSMAVKDDAIVLHFDHVGSGLVARGERLRGFRIAGEDQRFVPAEARIEGDTVVVRSSEVPKPVAVRYAWADDPKCNLANKDGLPAAPFRTDDWPGVTAGKR